MKRRHFLEAVGISAARLAAGAAAQPTAEPAGGNPIWPRPALTPIPHALAGVAEPVRSLGGRWKFTLEPPPGFWKNEILPTNWSELVVPGECTMQGQEIARDSEYPFKRQITVPAEFRGKRIFLRFDGVYSHGRVWVNGEYVREHRGGFTAWDCDITPLVTPGGTAWITIGVTDETDSISWQSNYAKHNIGGILREIRLLAAPVDYASRFHAETSLDANYADAQLKVTLGMAWSRAETARVELRLYDPQGQAVKLKPADVRLTHGASEKTVVIPVLRPEKWDCEHPRLHTLEARVMVNGAWSQTLRKPIGFRQVEVRGNQLWINGEPVKLRGACRHDVNPAGGRCVPPALDALDACLFKQANFNFVRTSHYPPAEAFLDACDREGLYVEEESAVCFVDQNHGLAGGLENNPAYTAQFMNQFAEMIERDRDHPSVIVWSLGNESRWGANFAQERAYARREDPSRPAIFSYPETVPAGTNAYDIRSRHYPKYNQDFSSAARPELNDEFGHIACYNVETLRRDPGVRNYWGASIRQFWDGMWTAKDCLGGAIWAGIDEVFMLPKRCAGYGEWGVLDGWRRPKPEYWLAKKAYSPVRISEAQVNNPGAGNPLRLPIENRFNHTHLSEITIRWRAGGDRGVIQGIELAPGAAGRLEIPARAWRPGEILELEFRGRDRRLLDRYTLPIGRKIRHFPAASGPCPGIEASNQVIRIAGRDFEVVFSKVDGLIRHAAYRGRQVLAGGPLLNLAPANLSGWWLSHLKISRTRDEAVVSLDGHYRRSGNFSGEMLVYAEFEVRIDGAGLITTHFRAQPAPGGLDEIGVAFLLTGETDQLAWERQALWSYYPADHIGRPRGMAKKLQAGAEPKYRRKPFGPWAEETKDFFLFGPEDRGGRGTEDFRSQKQNIWFASGIQSATGMRARAESDGTHAVRMELQRDSRVRMNINSAWAYPELGWGNRCPALTGKAIQEGTARLRLTDNDDIETTYADG